MIFFIKEIDKKDKKREEKINVTTKFRDASVEYAYLWYSRSMSS